MSDGVVPWDARGASVLALLLAAHLVADFVLQPWRMVAGKRVDARWLWAHGAVVLAVHAAVLGPLRWDGGRALAAAGALALAHVGIDRLKLAADAALGRRLAWFALDQVLHAGAAIAAWGLWMRATGAPAGPVRLDPTIVGAAASVAGAFAFAVNGGSAVVSGVLHGLRRSDGGDEPELEAPHAGHAIGILERLAMVPLVWLGQWGALGLVLAAKSVARFKDLEDREFAEVYLVGTLTSFLVAAACGAALSLLVPLASAG